MSCDILKREGLIIFSCLRLHSILTRALASSSDVPSGPCFTNIEASCSKEQAVSNGKKMDDCTHIAMIPFPAQGHQNPLMRLACRLVKLGEVRVTFFASNWFLESALKSREKGYEKLIDVVCIPIGDLQETDMKGNQSAVVKMIESTYAMEEPLQRALKDIVGRGERLDCLVSEAFLSWPQDVANRLGIPRVGFWPSSTPCTILIALARKLIDEDYVPAQDKLPERGNVRVEGIPGMSNLRLGDIPFTFYEPDRAGAEMNASHGSRMKEASCILLNSFTELDKEQLEGLRSFMPIPCLPVGPLLPNAILEDDKELQLPSFNFGEMQEDINCLSWLDQQEPGSVVYISFGSLANLSVSQLEALAAGLESSGVKFLWVIRPSLVEGTLSDSELFQEFILRTKSRGRIITWAPQLQVLGHASTALFVTHCGWNSTMESIWNGVPMLVWPCFADQNLNARYVVDEWQIGAAFKQSILAHPGTFVSSGEVQLTIQNAMADEGLRKRMAAASTAAKAAAKEGGSSYQNLKKLLEALRSGDVTFLNPEKQ